MAMNKKANGANFPAADGAIRFRFDGGGAPVVFVVCLWGGKPEFGGQRALVWRTEKLTSTADGDTVTMPGGIAMAGTQVTWSGGVIATGASQGRLLVTMIPEGGEEASFAYEYNFGAKNESESFYDGLNFT